MKKIFALFGVWLVAINLFGLIALNRVNVKQDTAYGWMDTLNLKKEQSWNLLQLHNRWDSGWYWGIVERGYYWDKVTGLSNIVFFPLYPFLVCVLATLLFGNFLLAAWLVSIAALLGAALMLYKLVKEFEPKADAELAVIFMLIFPTAIFFNSIYTESLFLFLSISSFYFTFKKKYLIAAGFLLLACLTRVTGVLLFVPLIIEYFLQERGKQLISTKVVPLLLAPLGTFAFMFVYPFLKFGDALLFFKMEKAWGRAFHFNIDHFHIFTHPAVVNLSLDVMFLGSAGLLMLFIAKRMRWSYAVYMFLTMAVALSTGTLMSIGRYIAVLFPMYIFASSIKSTLGKQAWAFASILLLALYTLLWSHLYWAG